MPVCKFKGCTKDTRYKNTSEKFCPMHKERIRRHGYPELKRDRGEHGLEKLPHSVDSFILNNCHTMIDEEIVKELKARGFNEANVNNVKYRRRKLGIKKYLYGEIKKHKAWVRLQAIKKYGGECELCGYKMAIDTHHIIPKYKGGPHEIENLMIVCPNCHALITRGKLILNNRKDIPRAKKRIITSLKKLYSFL